MIKVISSLIAVFVIACCSESILAETADSVRRVDPVEAFYGFFGEECESREGKNSVICENDLIQKKVTIGCMQIDKRETLVSIVEMPVSDKALQELVRLSCTDSFERTEAMPWMLHDLYIVW